MVNSKLVERLFSFAETPFEKGVAKKRKDMQGKSPDELMGIMKRGTRIIEAVDGIRGAETFVQDERTTREAARRELEK